MIVGFVLVLVAIIGGVGSLAYVCRLRQAALRNQHVYQHRIMRRPGTMEMQSCPAPLVQLKPVPTLSPAAEDEGQLRECPICFDEVTQNLQWLLLPCKHGVCVICYQKLVQDQHRVTTCPLCRMPLLEPAAAQPPPIAGWNIFLPNSNVEMTSWVQEHNRPSPVFVPQHLPQSMAPGSAHVSVAVAPIATMV